MLTRRQNHLPFTFVLVVGLMSGCGEDAPPGEPETMFPGPPDVYLGVDSVPDVLLRECAAACCAIPEDGVVVLDVSVSNWLLAPRDECGDEPQCGPVMVRAGWGSDELEVETVEDTLTINVLELVAEQGSASEPWPSEWIFVANTLPRRDPAFDHLIDVAVYRLQMFDEVSQREEDVSLCGREEGRFHVYADISTTTAPGTYVMRAGLDDTEVACTFEVSTGEDGLTAIEIPAGDTCAPAGLVAFSSDEIAESPDAPAGYRRAKLEPREPVERVSLEVSRAGEVLATGSHEPTSELTFPAGEECTLIPCQIAPAWGVTL